MNADVPEPSASPSPSTDPGPNPAPAPAPTYTVDQLLAEAERAALGLAFRGTIEAVATQHRINMPRVLEVGIGELCVLDLLEIPPDYYRGLGSGGPALDAARARHPAHKIALGVDQRDLAPDDAAGYAAVVCLSLCSPFAHGAHEATTKALERAAEALIPGGFAFFVAPGTKTEPEEGAPPGAGIGPIAIGAGFESARVAPVVQPGDRGWARAILEAVSEDGEGGAAGVSAERVGLVPRLAGELVDRAKRAGALGLVGYARARWHILVAIKRGPRLVLPESRGVVAPGAGPGRN
jgi:hypothetical protein